MAQNAMLSKAAAIPVLMDAAKGFMKLFAPTLGGLAEQGVEFLR